MPIEQQWYRACLTLMMATAAVIAIFWQTAHTMVEVWIHSRTYAHGLLVLPATCYLAWCYRDRLRELSPKSHGAGLLLLMILGCGWCLGTLTEMQWVRQIAVIAMLPALILAILGVDVLRALQVPLGFLVFALPVGTSIEPWLQKVTAMCIVLGLDLAGIAYRQEGFLITIPSGTWEIAPDCGGLRYLLPGLALGYVYTAVMHETLKERASFLALCALLLIVANGVRAYGIILADHLGLADGTDHRVFSYTIYSVTVVSLGWLGLRWKTGWMRLGWVGARQRGTVVTGSDPVQQR